MRHPAIHNPSKTTTTTTTTTRMASTRTAVGTAPQAPGTDRTGTTKRSLQKALAANRQLQKAVVRDLQEISRRKKENRLLAGGCLEELQRLWEGSGGSDLAPGGPAAAPASAGASGAGPSDGIPTARDLEALFASNADDETTTINSSSSNSNNRNALNLKTLRKRKQFRYDPHRKWTLEYFVDPTGSRPKDNPDVIRRRQWRREELSMAALQVRVPPPSDRREGRADEEGSGTFATAATGEAAAVPVVASRTRTGGLFFYHTSPPYTKQERAILDKLLSPSTLGDEAATTAIATNATAPDTGPPPPLRSYHDVARRLQEEMETAGAKSARLPTALPRTARDVQLYHQRLTASHYAFSREQSALIIEHVRRQAQQHDDEQPPPAAANCNDDEGTVAGAGVDGGGACAGGRKGGGSSINDDGGDDHDRADCTVHHGTTMRASPTRKRRRPDWVAISEALLEDYYRSKRQPQPPPPAAAAGGAPTGDENVDGDDGIHNNNSQQLDGDDSLSLPIVPPPPITPYQCMVHYKTRLLQQMQMADEGTAHRSPATLAAPKPFFTPEEDELLLRYIAAMGPQFVWDMQQISHLSARLFPGKTPRQLYERTTFSLWNPLATMGVAEGGTNHEDEDDYTAGLYWTRAEEQKLVLAMKIYSASPNDEVGDDDNDDDSDESILQGGKGNNKATAPISAIRRAAAHFHPQRPFDRVARKWERSLNPKLSQHPFTTQEDTKLLDVVRASSPTQNFGEIAREHFPNRSRTQIYQRWSAMTTMSQKNGAAGYRNDDDDEIGAPPFPAVPRGQFAPDQPRDDDGMKKGGYEEEE